MARITTYLLSAVLCLFVISGTGRACTCPPAGSPTEELGHAAAVFLGRVIAIETHSGDTRVTMEVEHSWKGVESDTIEIHTSDGDCGYLFVSGAEYVVYADRVNGALVTSQCSRTRVRSQAAEDIRDLSGHAWNGETIFITAGVETADAYSLRTGVGVGAGAEIPIAGSWALVARARYFLMPVGMKDYYDRAERSSNTLMFGIGLRYRFEAPLFLQAHIGYLERTVDRVDDAYPPPFLYSWDLGFTETCPFFGIDLRYEFCLERAARPFVGLGFAHALVNPVSVRWNAFLDFGVNINI